MDVLQEGSRWLEEQRLQFMTRKVLYQRGTSSVEVSAKAGSCSVAIVFVVSCYPKESS